MENKKKSWIILCGLILVAVAVTCVLKFGEKNTPISETQSINAAMEQSSDTDETEEDPEYVDGEKISFDAMRILYANEDHTYITSEDLYDHMDKVVGYNFITTVKIDKITNKEATIIFKEGEPSILIKTAENYIGLVKSGDEVTMIGTIFDYKETDGKKIPTAWVSFLASGEETSQYKEDVTDPNFTDLFE